VGIVWSQVGDGYGPTGIISDDFAGGQTNIDGNGSGLLKSAYDTVVFLESEGSDTIYAIPLSGGSPTFLASSAYVSDFVTDGTYVYCKPLTKDV
jgi:hypothetical protein